CEFWIAPFRASTEGARRNSPRTASTWLHCLHQMGFTTGQSTLPDGSRCDRRAWHDGCSHARRPGCEPQHRGSKPDDTDGWLYDQDRTDESDGKIVAAAARDRSDRRVFICYGADGNPVAFPKSGIDEQDTRAGRPKPAALYPK